MKVLISFQFIWAVVMLPENCIVLEPQKFMLMLNSVYILYHTRVDAFGCENDKCLGVFSDLDKVEQAKQYALKQKGFRDYPDGFSVSEYQINKQEWPEGFGD